MPAGAMGNTVVPRPNAILKVPSVNPRPLRPIVPPSRPFSDAVLPPSFRELVNQPPFHFNDLYVWTSHIVPAATPRTIGSPEPAAPEDKAARKAWVKRTTKDVVERRLAYDRRESVEGYDVDTQLFNVVDRYARTEAGDRKRTGRALTLLLIHGNGSPRRVGSCRSFCWYAAALTTVLLCRYGSRPCDICCK